MRGPLLEENHYYPFGLTMAGISNKALKENYAENHKKYNGIEHTTDFDLNTYDAFFRNLDPQIGRWWQVDPKPTDWESPYSGMCNIPILRNDPLGDTEIYNEQGQKIANYGSRDVNYVIRTTKLTAQLGSSDPGTISKPISAQAAQRAEAYITEANLWSEAVPVNLSPTKKDLVQIKNTDQIQAAEKAVSLDDGTGGARPQNNREYHGAFTAKGVAPNPPGSVADPSKGLPATSVSYGNIDYHSHPSGNKRIVLPSGRGATASWNQPPSGQDIKTAKSVQYIFAMQEQTIYIYNRTGVIATVPIGSIKK